MPHLTINTPATAELEEKGSRFIGHLVPWVNLDATLAQLRIDHRKASHHVTSFRHMLPDNRIEEGAKDDGEPAGTSGMPTLKVLIGANLVDVGLIIVRYFGGTKLGSGGLARAYSGTALRTIEAATLTPWHRAITRVINCAFDEMSDMERRISASGLTVTARDFTETGVELTVEGPEELVTALAE